MFCGRENLMMRNDGKVFWIRQIDWWEFFAGACTGNKIGLELFSIR
jgi:hypothetical protein